MAKSAILAGTTNSGSVYRIGRVGFDGGSPASLDSGSQSYTGTLETERISPVGEGGLAHFRRVALRVLRSGGYEATITVFVDDEQTQIYNTSSDLEDQSVVVTGTAQPLGEDIIEVDISAVGTFIQVKVEVQSEDVTGVFLPEYIETHFYPVRAAESREAESQ